MANDIKNKLQTVTDTNEVDKVIKTVKARKIDKQHSFIKWVNQNKEIVNNDPVFLAKKAVEYAQEIEDLNFVTREAINRKKELNRA